MKPNGQRKGIGLSRRELAGLPVSVNRESRSFPIVITTETPVRTWIPNPAVAELTKEQIEYSDISWIEVDEVLLTAGLDYSRTSRMPLLDSHDRWSIDSILGRVDNVRAEDGKVIGEAVVRREHDAFLTGIEDGFFGQFSAGYVVNAYEITERENNVPLAVAVSWTLHETSAVPIGADPNATARGQREFPMPSFRKREADPQLTQEKIMELETLVTAAEDALKAVVDAADEGATEEVLARARKLREFAGTPDDEAAAAAGEEGARAEGDEPVTAEEDKENANLEAAAERAFAGLGQFVKGLRSFGAKPFEIRAAVKTEMLKRGASGTATADVTPIKPKASGNKIDARSYFANLNARGRK